jgi:hypothetical protein
MATDIVMSMDIVMTMLTMIMNLVIATAILTTMVTRQSRRTLLDIPVMPAKKDYAKVMIQHTSGLHLKAPITTIGDIIQQTWNWE